MKYKKDVTFLSLRYVETGRAQSLHGIPPRSCVVQSIAITTIKEGTNKSNFYSAIHRMLLPHTRG